MGRHRHFLRAVAVTTAAGATALGGASTATADPVNRPDAEIVPLICDNGVTYEVAVAGNGQFTPGHDLNSTAMLIPVEFTFTGTVTDPEGNVETIDEQVSKGSANRPRATTTTCTFHFEGTEDGFTFDIDGTVTGFVTPVR